jgi:cytochrome c553
MATARPAVVISLLWATAACGQGVDTTLARNIAAGCANCHGTNGASVSQVPALAGMQRAEITAKMKEFKSGQRPGSIMPQLAKGYTDEQIELAAAWFAMQARPAK